MTEKIYDLKTDYTEASLQIAIEGFEVNISLFDKDLKQAEQDNRSAEVVFRLAEVKLAEYTGELLLDMTRIHDHKLKTSPEDLRNQTVHLAVSLSGLASLALALSSSYFKLLGKLAIANDTDALLACEVTQEEAVSDYFTGQKQDKGKLN